MLVIAAYLSIGALLAVFVNHFHPEGVIRYHVTLLSFVISLMIFWPYVVVEATLEWIKQRVI